MNMFETENLKKIIFCYHFEDQVDKDSTSEVDIVSSMKNSSTKVHDTFNNQVSNDSYTTKADNQPSFALHTCKEVIIAEDNSATLQKQQDYFKHNGIPQSAFQNGRDALSQIKRVSECENCRKLMVLTDSDMPVMDGFELAKEIRDLDITSKRISIMLATAEAKVTQLMFDEVLQKPVDLRKFHEFYSLFYVGIKSSKSLLMNKQEYYAMVLKADVKTEHIYETKNNKLEDETNDAVSKEHVCLEILLVEDQAKTMNTQTAFLDEKNISYKKFYNGKECQTQLEESDALMCKNCNKTLIVTDYQMPLMNGVELTTLIRDMKLRRNVQVALLSADDVQGCEHLIDEFLYKPVGGQEVQDIQANFFTDELLTRQERDINKLKNLKADYAKEEKNKNDLMRLRSKKSDKSTSLNSHVCNALLLVDDHQSTIDKYETQCLSEGIPFVSFSNGNDCLFYISYGATKVCMNCNTIAVVTDYFMPGMNGVELAKNIKLIEDFNKKMDLTLVSADEVYGSESLFERFIEKPLDLRQLKNIHHLNFKNNKTNDSIIFD